jgi:hypothetical protein
MDNIPVIDNWACIYNNGDVFTPPELRGLMVDGRVKGHPKYPDDEIILTSIIRKVEKDIIFTQNSIYRLGEPRKDWLDWLKENGIKFDPENPIKIR